MPDTTTDYARGFRAGIEAAARLARNACLVPPDGGEPTPEESVLCDEIADAIRALAPAAPEPSEAEVERVARAICSARGHNPDWEVVWGEKSCKWWEVFAKDARAALAAMGRV